MRFLISAWPSVGPTIRIIAAAVALSAVSIGLRIEMINSGIATLPDALRITTAGLRNSYFDLALIWGAAAACLLLLLLAGRLKHIRNLIVLAFYGFALVSVLLACINVVAVALIGGSLTFQWIYYADLFRSFTSQSAVRPALNASFFAMVSLSLASWLAIYAGVRGILNLTQRAGLLLPVLILGFFGLGGYFIAASGRLEVTDSERGNLTNPLLELVTTAMAAPAAGLLATEDPIAQPQLPPPMTSPNLLPAGLATGSIRNVVLIVMESVGANYVAGTGPAEAAQWTPRIASYSASTLAFRNFYAHAPQSTKSLFSLLTSLYPLFSFEVETTKLHDVALQTLSSRLKSTGLRTAFFMSGDFEFQSVDTFLDGRGFDLRSDMRDIPCAMPTYIGSTSEWPHLDSIDDSCTAGALTRWIDAEDRPFFAMLWTGNTHWPYFSGEIPAPRHSSIPHQNRYLGAVRSSDAAIGNVLDHLAKRGLLDSTLVVVIGDHGEAFREHGFGIHGNSIYEEEMRIPLLLINSRIGTSAPYDTLGGIIDIAPTILHVLGLPPEPAWEGRSLFDPNRPDRVFLFAPNQDMVAGYRQDNYKFMYRVARNTALVFDLATDPAERRNIADDHSARTIRRHLSGWLQKQDSRFRGLAR